MIQGTLERHLGWVNNLITDSFCTTFFERFEWSSRGDMHYENHISCLSMSATQLKAESSKTT